MQNFGLDSIFIINRNKMTNSIVCSPNSILLFDFLTQFFNIFNPKSFSVAILHIQCLYYLRPVFTHFSTINNQIIKHPKHLPIIQI